MRILITTDVVGGVWQFTHDLAAGLLREGSSVALVSLGGSPTAEQADQCARLRSEYRNNFQYESCPVPLEWMQENHGAYFDAVPLLSRIARDFAADLVHANQFCFGAFPLDIPKIITAHSDVLSWAEACRSEPLENSPWLRQYRRLVADGLKGASAIVAPTQWMLNALRKNFPLRIRCEVIPNGRTLAPTAPGERQLRAITAARLWDEAKDVRMLGDVSAPVPICAAGQVQHGSASAPASLGSVRLLGRLSQEELLDFFRQSAIYICTSRYEPFGLAPLEAAHCGCAVLARDIPSLREVWQDAALYFSDAQSLSALLDQLADDSALLVAAQERSFARAQSFTAEQMLAAYRNLFARALKDAEKRTYAA